MVNFLFWGALIVKNIKFIKIFWEVCNLYLCTSSKYLKITLVAVVALSTGMAGGPLPLFLITTLYTLDWDNLKNKNNINWPLWVVLQHGNNGSAKYIFCFPSNFWIKSSAFHVLNLNAIYLLSFACNRAKFYYSVFCNAYWILHFLQDHRDQYWFQEKHQFNP